MTTPSPSKNLTNLKNAVDLAEANANRFRTEAKSPNAFFAAAGLITEEQRKDLTSKERLAFYAKAIEGIEPKFTLKQDLSAITDPTKFVGSDFFAKSLDFNLQVKTLKQHIDRHLMTSVFFILNVEEKHTTLFQNDVRSIVKRDDKGINLLDDYTSVDLNSVLLSSEYYVTYSDKDIDAENMQWSQELILNSCDDEMKHYLMSRLCLLPPEQHGGPTLFMMLVEQIVSNNEYLSRALITRLNSFKITMIPGENIEQAAAFIKTVCHRLDSCQKLPSDAERIVFDIMLTCTVDRFKQHFYTLESAESPKLLTYDGVLREAVRFYTVLHTGINQWLPLEKASSVYNGTGSTNTLPRGQPNQKAKQTHDAKGNPIDRNPPAKGEPTFRPSKINEGRKEYWCSVCERWGSHDDEHHDAWKQRTQDFFKRTKKGKGSTEAAGSANAADGNTPQKNQADDESTSKSTITTAAGSSNYTMVQRLKRVAFSDE